MRRWRNYGHLVFLHADTSVHYKQEGAIVPGEVNCRASHNRALDLVDAIGKPCVIIEDDAAPAETLVELGWPKFSWYEPKHIQLNGRPLGTYGYLATPGLERIGYGRAADHWPETYPLTIHPETLIMHTEDWITTIPNRPGWRGKLV